MKKFLVYKKVNNEFIFILGTSSPNMLVYLHLRMISLRFSATAANTTVSPGTPDVSTNNMDFNDIIKYNIESDFKHL
jgi:hypothetical protein